MNTTFKPIIKKIFKDIGSGHIIHHDPTDENRLGQSSLATLINDILDVVDAAPNSSSAVKDLHRFFRGEEM